MNRNPVTPEGYEKLLISLKHEKEVVRPGIVKDIEEARAHLSLWIIQASVLKIDNDVRSIPPSILKLLTNKDVWSVHQDPLGLAGKRIDVGEDRGVTTDWRGQTNGGGRVRVGLGHGL